MLGQTPLQGVSESINESAMSGPSVTGVDYLMPPGWACVTLTDCGMPDKVHATLKDCTIRMYRKCLLHSF